MLSRSEIEHRARHQFGEPNRRLSSRHDLRFGKRGSVSVRLTGDKQGAWYDHESCQGGSLLNRDDFPDYQRPPPRPRRISHDSESADQLRRSLNNLSPARNSPAELYLQSRGIHSWPEHCIRFCRQPFGLAALAQDGAGNVRAIQIVYLTDDGKKRHDLPVVKRTYTAVSGWHEIAAVRLPGRGEPILCEGVETGLSIWVSVTRPVFACLGAAGVRALRVSGSRLTIARDGDEPGSKADIFHQRTVGYRRNRYRVRVASPPVGQDFNDVLLEHGPDEVARIIRNAA